MLHLFFLKVVNILVYTGSLHTCNAPLSIAKSSNYKYRSLSLLVYIYNYTKSLLIISYLFFKIKHVYTIDFTL